MVNDWQIAVPGQGSYFAPASCVPGIEKFDKLELPFIDPIQFAIVYVDFK
jgi:hypothetical protein